MNDSNSITQLRIEGRPTAVAGRVAHFGSLSIELVPDAPTLNMQTHCVIHARLQRDGDRLVWKQVDRAFQVIGHVSGPADVGATPRNDSPGSRQAVQSETAGAAQVASAQGEAATQAQERTAAGAAQPRVGGNVSSFRAAAQARSGPAGVASAAPQGANTPAAAPSASPATAAAKTDPYRSLLGQPQGSGAAGSQDKATPASSAPRAAPPAATPAKPTSGGNPFAQLAGARAPRAQTPTASSAAPNTGFRAGEEDELGDVPF